MAYNAISEGFVSAYLEQANQIYQTIFNEQISSKERKILRNTLRERMTDPEILITHTVFSEKQAKTSLLTVIDQLYRGKYVLSGYGMLFKPGDLETNFTGAMLNDIILARSKVKKQYLNLLVEDPLRAATLDNRQKTLKLIANSWYGAMNQSSFQFYNKAIGASTTYTGYILTTTVIMGLEGHMYDNVDFFNIDDVVVFFSNLKADYKNHQLDITNYVDAEKLLPEEEFRVVLKNKILSKCQFQMSSAESIVFDEILSGMCADEMYRAYFKRNMVDFIDNREVIKLFANSFDVGFLDPAEPSKETNAKLESIDVVIEEFVSYYYMYRNRYEQANNMSRKAILHADTDSVFMILDSLFKKYEKFFPIESYGEETEKTVLNICCIFINILNRFIHRLLFLLCDHANVNIAMIPKMKMKSEFLIKRILMTPNAKSYAGLVMAQEGKVFTSPKVDIKGLQIKKVSAAKETRRYFTEILENDILKAEDIKMAEIIRNVSQFKRNIRESFSVRKEVTFSDPKTFNSFDSYDDGYTQQAVRGTIVWNALFPDHPIEPFSSVNLIKLSSPKLEELEVLWAEYPDKIAAIKSAVYENERMNHYGLGCVCLPKSVSVLPDCLIPLIDAEEHVKTNVSAFMPVLNALGCEPIYNGSSAQMTKFIRM